jgi:hypothetical protein
VLIRVPENPTWCLVSLHNQSTSLQSSLTPPLLKSILTPGENARSIKLYNHLYMYSRLGLCSMNCGPSIHQAKVYQKYHNAPPIPSRTGNPHCFLILLCCIASRKNCSDYPKVFNSVTVLYALCSAVIICLDGPPEDGHVESFCFSPQKPKV